MSAFELTLDTRLLDRIAAGVPAGADKVVARAARRIETRIKGGMAGAKGGRYYGAHQASAPGEMPAVDTGALRASVNVQKTGVPAERLVAVGAEYGPYLEYGTRYMAARPFMGPSFEADQAAFTRDVEALLDGDGK